MNNYRLFLITKYLLLLLCTAVMAVSCKQTPPSNNSGAKSKARVSFKKVRGIAYTEVRREYDNHLGYNNYGYHLEPEWQITFLSDDSVRIFSLVLQKFIVEPVIIDHDSVATVAHSWLRVKKLTKDSILFQVLYVANQKIDDKSNIYMTLYSNDYIKNVLHTTADKLQTPPRRDSLYIKKKTEASIANINKAFAATEPANLISNNPNVTVTKKNVTKAIAMENVTLADNYLSPTFTVTIHKAYNTFNYSMQVIADEKGKLHFVKSMTYIPDDVDARLKVMKGVVDGYLTVYLITKPGTTLGIAHPSRILVRVIGIED
ncbi:hypothetical protein ACFQ3S_13740 [Mucilaginibacter terrae]|uniref:hypothetical protein n=1 Tax=Mucilaginibacter terrae TaxID=1955052 RepID=UPI00362D2F6A